MFVDRFFRRDDGEKCAGIGFAEVAGVRNVRGSISQMSRRRQVFVDRVCCRVKWQLLPGVGSFPWQEGWVLAR